MMDQALKINRWGKNVFVKVPIVNTKNKFTGKGSELLNDAEVRKAFLGG